MSKRSRMYNSVILGIASSFIATSTYAASLSVGVRSGAESMDPHFSAVGINVSAMKNVYETLTARDNNLQLAPGLAVSWELVNDTTWHFKLRQGVKFHDGSSLDAADVVHSINRIPKAAGPDGGLVTYTRRIVEANAIDDLTVELKTDSPAATLPLDLTRLFVIPSEVPIDTPVGEFNSGSAAVGTGPYKLVSWKAKGDMVVEPFSGYWGDKGAWDKVTFSEISNDSARVAALLSGRVDMINYAPPTDVARIRSESNLEVFSGSSVYIFMMFPDYADDTKLISAKDGSKLSANPLQDLRVRKALSLAVNRDAIASRVMEGLATPASQIITKGFFG